MADSWWGKRDVFINALEILIHKRNWSSLFHHTIWFDSFIIRTFFRCYKEHSWQPVNVKCIYRGFGLNSFYLFFLRDRRILNNSAIFSRVENLKVNVPPRTRCRLYRITFEICWSLYNYFFSLWICCSHKFLLQRPFHKHDIHVNF